METWQRLFVIVLAAALGATGCRVWYLGRELEHKQTVLELRTTECNDLRADLDAVGRLRQADVKAKDALQAKWDKEQAWVQQYKAWRADWVKKQQGAVPIDAFVE